MIDKPILHPHIIQVYGEHRSFTLSSCRGYLSTGKLIGDGSCRFPKVDCYFSMDTFGLRGLVV